MSLPDHYGFMVSAITLKQSTHWRCDSCLFDFPSKVESIIISIVTDDLLRLCPPCGRHLGRGLMKVSSIDRKKTTKIHY